MISGELTNAESLRYSRQILLPGFGVEGQLRLKKARVLIVGAGGLGTPVVQYLTAAGVGTIGLIDGDTVDVSNLQRQVLYRISGIGNLKVEEARAELQELNPLVRFETYPFRLDALNAEELIKQYDVVVDGSDNFSTRYLVNDACVVLSKPLIAASLFQFSGQLSVFNTRLPSGELGPTYRCLFPEPPQPDRAPNCAQSGVVGALVGVMGSLQALEVIKVLTGVGEALIGKLLVYDALENNFQILQFQRNEAIAQGTRILPASEYEYHCADEPMTVVKEISVGELHQKLTAGEDILLIDVREPFERDISSIGGELIPLGKLAQFVERIPRDKLVVIYCRSGGRSFRAVEMLQSQHQFKNLVNLSGGILAWSNLIDPAVKKY